MRNTAESAMLVRTISSTEAGFVTSQKFVLDKPVEVKSAREKVLYALWHAGELAYHKIHLYTDLSTQELNESLAELLEVGTIVKTRNGLSLDDEKEFLSSGTYRISE